MSMRSHPHSVSYLIRTWLFLEGRIRTRSTRILNADKGNEMMGLSKPCMTINSISTLCANCPVKLMHFLKTVPLFLSDALSVRRLSACFYAIHSFNLAIVVMR